VNELMAISAEFVEKLITARAERIVSPYFVDPGVTVRPLAAGERTARERHCAEMTYELMFVLDGAGDVMINDRLYIGGAGTVFLIPPGTPHDSNYGHNQCTGMHLWMIVWENLVRYSLFRVAPGDCRPENNCNLRVFRHFDQELYRVISDLCGNVVNNPLSREQRREFMALIDYRAAQLVRIEREAPHTEAIGNYGRDFMIVQQVKKYIGRRSGRGCQINMLAEMFGCSRSRFLKIFRKYAGCTVLEFVDRERILRYRGFPASTPVKQIAAELGFRSSSSFIHWRQRNMAAITDTPQHGDWRQT
ncbi:MAG: helix-turn-helix transcriptional regulator, partial [Lentisphaeria bacterium]|nr:helix-turn-helix transcriptional regulator [Lentisphaeria bacterium]